MSIHPYAYGHMAEKDYVIRSVHFTEPKHTMYVMAHFSGMSMTWPPLITDGKGGKTFKFVCNEVMEDFMVGNYSGHAKYVEV
jgi:hypothetical protein